MGSQNQTMGGPCSPSQAVSRRRLAGCARSLPRDVTRAIACASSVRGEEFGVPVWSTAFRRLRQSGLPLPSHGCRCGAGCAGVQTRNLASLPPKPPEGGTPNGKTLTRVNAVLQTRNPCSHAIAPDPHPGDRPAHLGGASNSRRLIVSPRKRFFSDATSTSILQNSTYLLTKSGRRLPWTSGPSYE
jgi:hypothetical protein